MSFHNPTLEKTWYVHLQWGRSLLVDVRIPYEQVFNLQRLAVLTTALTRSPPDPELIFEAMKDRVHQPYRRGLVRLR